MARFQPFWEWFIEHRETISSDMRSNDKDRQRETVHRVDSRIGEVAPGVGFVYGHSGKPNRFVITANGIRERIPLVEEMLESAPKLDDWEFVAFRPPSNATSDFQITIGEDTLDIEDVVCRAFDLREEGIGVTLYPRQMCDENYDRIRTLATILMDHVIGEYASMTLIDSLRVDPLSEMHSTKNAVLLSELREFLEEISDNRDETTGR